MASITVTMLLAVVTLVGVACVRHHQFTMCCGRVYVRMMTVFPLACGPLIINFLACCVLTNARFTVMYERLRTLCIRTRRPILRAIYRRDRNVIPPAHVPGLDDDDLGGCSVYTIFNDDTEDCWMEHE